MHRFTLSVLLVATLFLSGCAFWRGFKAGVTGEPLTPEVVSTQTEVGEQAGNILKESAPYLPSPWREIVVAIIASVTGWGAAKRDEAKKEEFVWIEEEEEEVTE